MTTFEEHIANLMGLEGFQSYDIEEFDCFHGKVNYWINGVQYQKTYVDSGDGVWIETGSSTPE